MSDKPKACKNCTGPFSSLGRSAKGYCHRCYRVMRYIEEVQAWDRSRRESLKRIPKDGAFDPAVGYSKSTGLITDSRTAEEFEIIRREHIRQLKLHLSVLRHRQGCSTLFT
jgi:hypothetical protein